MKHILDEVKALPGVVGACLYVPGQGLRGSNLPSVFRPERLTAIGRQLFKMHAAGRMSFADLTEISLHYDESVIVVRELQEELLLIILCDPDCNMSLLHMSLNLVHEELRTGHYQPAASQPPAAVGTPPAGQNDAPVELDGRLRELLDSLQTKLGKVLGPMAGLIFEETVEIWQKQGHNDLSALPALLELVEREIGDDEKIARYRRLIAPDLPAGNR